MWYEHYDYNGYDHDGSNQDGTGPSETRLTTLTTDVARAVVLVDGVGHCIDAAAGGASGTSSTLAEEAAMLTRAGKMSGKTQYKGRGRGGNALTDFTALRGKMDASSVAQRIRRIQLERFAAEFSDLVGRLKDCGTHYKSLIEQVRRAKMSSLPRDIGYPLKTVRDCTCFIILRQALTLCLCSVPGPVHCYAEVARGGLEAADARRAC